jgi:hypothetical protein
MELIRGTFKHGFLPVALIAAALFTAGCAGSGGANSSSDIPVPPAGTQGTKSYTYAGTQSADGTISSGGFYFWYGGAYTSNQDDSSNYFSYLNVGHAGYQGQTSIPTGPNSGVLLPYGLPVTGSYTGSGFLSLTPAAAGAPAGSGGYAVELPGEGQLLRPAALTPGGGIYGGASNENVLHPSSPMVAPMVSAASAACPTLSGNVTYQFIAMGSQFAQDVIEHTVYGSVQISGAGTVFTFSNLKMYGFAGDSLSPAALPVGNCGTTQQGYVINSTESEQYFQYGNVAPTGPYTGDFTLTTSLSPSGLFVMDQGQGSPYFANGLPGTTSMLGLVGVQQPASPINTSTLVAGKYLGFQYDALDVGFGRAASIPVSFGQVAGSGTVMTGGGYANDDVTQTPATNITINLGQQDSANNGLYKSVTATVPDTFGGCLEQPFGGKDSSGNPTCTFAGVAVAGSVGGKFVIFVSVNDLSQAIRKYSPYASLQFFLYQQ